MSSSPAERIGPDTLVIGLGNPLMGDDGLGLVALERLAGDLELPAEVRLLDGGTLGLQLLPYVEDAGRLLLLDVIAVGRPAGHLVVLERETLPRFFAQKLSPHEIGLREVLALAELRGRLPQDIVAIGLEPARVTLSTGLSAPVEQGLPAMLAAVVDRLRAWGHRIGGPAPSPVA